MKFILLLNDGFGIRNFLLTKFILLFGADDHVIIVHNQSEKLVSAYKRVLAEADCQISWEKFYQGKHLVLTKDYSRQILTYAHMHNSTTRAHKLMLKYYPHNAKFKHRFFKSLSRVFATKSALNILDRLICKLEFSHEAAVQHYQALIEKFQPSLVISSSHWRPEMFLPILIAQQNGIPTATFIPSWDNITSKNRISIPFDYYLVWGQTMADELLEMYPELKPEQIKTVGTPQFDIYTYDEQRWSKDEFLEFFGLDSKRPVISYAGGAPVTTPDEPKYLEILLRQISDGTIKGNPQVIFRPAPVDDIKRYADVIAKYPELVVSHPDWDFSTMGPFPKDPEVLHNLIYHSDVIVNITSTITLDAAVLDKPTVNPAFDVSTPLPHKIPLWDFHFQFEHYRNVVEIGAAKISHSQEDLAKQVNLFLEKPSVDSQQREKFVKSQLGVPIGESCIAIVSFIKSLC